MAARTPLPGALGTGSFTVSEAHRLLVTRGRLRNPELQAPTRGVRRLPAGELGLLEHATAFASVLPDDVVFSHLTAARLHELPTPHSWPGPAEPLHVMRKSDRPRVDRTGCRHHRGLEHRHPAVVAGLRVTSAVDTWCDLAGWAQPHLLAAADALLRRSVVSGADLVEAAAARRGRRGSDDLRTISQLARAGAASPGESLARWWFWQWGVPEPELNVPVLDANGNWLATSDFVWKSARVVGEYDGDVHRTDRDTWLRDRERRACVEDAGWSYVELTAYSLGSPGPREALRTRLLRLLVP